VVVGALVLLGFAAGAFLVALQLWAAISG